MLKSNYKDIKLTEPTVVTIGNFDGVHKGHRFLMEKTIKTAIEEGIKSAVLTFSPHPRVFLRHENFMLISTDVERAIIFEGLGLDYRIFAEFNDELSSLLPIDFVNKILVEALSCRRVIIGENFTFGRNKSGNAEILSELCIEKNIAVDICSSVVKGGLTISSERIRGLLAEGSVEEAKDLLGEPYFIYGEVVRGKNLGRTLGFPTINLDVDNNKLLPKYGVYFTQTVINERKYNGITNVGIRPTVGGKERSAETFLFDFEGDVYGEKATVLFLKRQRDEIKFDGVDRLKDAISADKQKAAEYFEQMR